MSRRPVFRSVALKLFAGVAGCVVLALTVLLLLNTFALKGYYVRQKQKQVAASYTAINTACDDLDRLEEELLDLQDNGAITVVLWNDRQLLFSNQKTDRFRIRVQPDYAPGTYEMAVTREDELMTGNNARDQVILLLGTLDNGWYVYLRTPVAAIEESIAVTNRFLLISGIAALAVALAAVLVVSRWYADPIRQLSRVADRVAQLDFDGRYEGKAQDEFGQLGRSINAMSAALEQTVTQLKNANARLTADIAQKEERDTARRAFIANVSHELKTPIALIGTYAEGLREDIAAGGENREYYCEVIEDEAHKISQLLRRMTMLMQLEGGDGQLEIERFDIVELVRNLIGKNRIRFDGKQVSLTVPAPTPVAVYADPYLIENVVSNFLSNAYQYVPENGQVAVTVVPQDDGRVRVAVFNSGDPIPPEELPRIWESFYKVDKARTRSYGGSGIGLSVVAAIMKAHAMPFGVNNLPGGVEFYIELETQ